MIQAVAVVGPTASGKTALAVALAKALDTEIVSADSMQFYRGMEIGTGAPSPEELAAVKHHFVGCLDPSDDMSASDFEHQARAVVADLNGRGKTAVVVGGSGLYIRALIDGLFIGPAKDPAIRARLHEEAEQHGATVLYERLCEIDSDYADIIHENDLRRVVRALEVHEITGVPLSRLHREHRGGADCLDAVHVALDYPRDELYARIERRVDGMFEHGLVDEVRVLVARGYEDDLCRLKSLGYREVLAALKNEITVEEAKDRMKRFTRRYAKRQLSWLRSDERVTWLDAARFTTTEERKLQVLSDLVEFSQ